MSELLHLVADEETQCRLDQFLASHLDGVSRTKIKSWCQAGLVEVNGATRKASFLLNGGENITAQVPAEKEPTHIEPENIPLDIIYEDEDIALINKAPGMVVHPGAGISSGTLVNALAYHFQQLSSAGGEARPGIVHRLDKGTSGIILVAKTDEAHAHLTAQWQAGGVTKVYQALVWGHPQPEAGEIETTISRHPRHRQKMAANVEGGKAAHSRYKTTELFSEAARINVHILTGRTHQIRVHMAFKGNPVVGDALYGKNRHQNLAKQFADMPEFPMLHAALLRFKHPRSDELKTFKLSPPHLFEATAKALANWPYGR